MMASRICLIEFPAVPNHDSGSPFCTKVHRILRFKGLAYTTEDLRMPPDKNLNPERKLPVLKYGARMIGDSTRIAYFLEEKHPDPPLIPKERDAWARMHLMEDWADNALYFMVVYLRWMIPKNAGRVKKLFFGKESFPVSALAPIFVPRMIRGVLEKQGIGRQAVRHVKREFERNLDSLEFTLEKTPYLVGDDPTLADLAVFAQLDAVFDDATPRDRDEIRNHTHVLRWFEKIDARTAPPKPLTE